mmetsp:Transcript_2358/g.7522  ORF Transcript_2358/g.7522 Transcript_2358/m.7522 type:complete len:403 (+) Transcript_2358:293-1501(+)
MTSFLVQHVMTAFHIFDNVTLSVGRTKGLDRKELTLFHPGLFTAFHNGYTLAGVNLVRTNAVTVQVANRFDRVDIAVNLKLIALHGLLNGFAHITQANIDPGRADTCVGGCLDCLKKCVELRIECHCECAVNDATVHLCAEIQLHHIVVLQDSVITGVRGVVSGHVIDTASSRESDARIEAILLDQLAVHGLDLFTHVDELHTRLDDGLRKLAGLAMRLSGVTDIFEVGVGELLTSNGTFLLVCGALQVLVASELVHRIGTTLEEIRYRNCGRKGLSIRGTSPITEKTDFLLERSSGLLLLSLALLLLLLRSTSVRSRGGLRRLLGSSGLSSGGCGVFQRFFYRNTCHTFFSCSLLMMVRVGCRRGARAMIVSSYLDVCAQREDRSRLVGWLVGWSVGRSVG